ncbi:TonB-dependent siderophore receptor [Piscinibacter sp. XHJ-5]|uniref:TonB-dependent siderophore receptor n=1 Tax=Piscinibacter sp. XHJ-5 TaxID=3037797 RepID=UPI002452BC8F|nr:TonB-dependent siderophore receptor [Piscinibacter sp. XHJ-5]
MASRIPFLALAVACTAQAQTTTTLSPVTITGRGDPVIDVGGWGDVPLSKSPFSASITTSEQMRERGVQRLADIVRIDPAVSDAYNAEGYWDSLTVRGFVIDNRSNYRRDGLPINAETRIPLDNKDRVELLKGTSGLQAGVSAPGGLVNFVVKRPTTEPLREARLGWQQKGSLLAAVDLSQRFGDFGLRLNAAAERLDPHVRDARGERTLLALAGEWRLAPGTLLEAEVETSHRRQPSVPGFSLIGAMVPAPPDPRINLNNQPWSLPVVFDGTNASLRFSQRLDARWRWTAHAATQRLKTDDRIAFPFGCSAENAFDRYCSDGTFDLYDFRSENERRRTNALEVAVHGNLNTGGAAHALSAGVLRSDLQARFQGQAFNWVGIGNVAGTLVTPEDPTLAPPAGDRDERSTELFVRDAVRFGRATTAWLGLRHTRLARGFSQSFTTPSVAFSHELAGGPLVYASWGQGVETAVTPNLPSYGSAAGQPLAAQKSRQIELGAKGRQGDASWGIAWFDITQPKPTDTGTAFFIDGEAHHRGVEATAAWQLDRWTIQGGMQLVHARREGSQDPEVNGKRPTNVPASALKLQVRHDLATVQGLSLQADALAESDRIVLADNSARIPGFGRLDLSARWQQSTPSGTFIWRAGLDNAFDRRAWKEAPLQFGHVYLFPLPPRTLRLSVEASL